MRLTGVLLILFVLQFWVWKIPSQKISSKKHFYSRKINTLWLTYYSDWVSVNRLLNNPTLFITFLLIHVAKSLFSVLSAETNSPYWFWVIWTINPCCCFFMIMFQTVKKYFSYHSWGLMANKALIQELESNNILLAIDPIEPLVSQFQYSSTTIAQAL